MTEASFVLPAFGTEYVLDVRLNENLFPKRYVETHYTEDSKLVTRYPDTHHHCYYHGVVREGNSSSVAISTCKGISGMVDVDGESLRVEPLEGSSWQHVVYREKDVVPHPDKLVMDVVLDSHLPKENLERISKGRHRRDILSETKYVELAIINDDAEYRLRGNDLSAVQERSKQIANIMDMLYKALNIRIALVAVEVWMSPQFQITHDPNENLSKFQVWRMNNLNPRITNDNAQLITAIPFINGIIGMAEHGKMCTNEKSCGVNADVELPIARQTVIIIHEMGHNLGFSHNTDRCTCEDDACIMDATLAEPAPTKFTDCTRHILNEVLHTGYGVCLLDYPKEFYGGPVCGNNFLEDGEDCDCGTPEECDTKCCIPETCQFSANATCAEGKCCDENCQMVAAGTLCRDTFNECDLPEYCTGRSAECPGNVYIQNGEKCNARDEARCYDGQCQSYQRQCEEVWGKGTGVRVGIDKCFSLNTQGSFYASCGETDEDPCPTGRDSPEAPCYKRCEHENVKCGRLMCEYVPNRPILTDIASVAPGIVYDDRMREHVCMTVSFDFGDDVPDPGYVADGTSCGEGKICLNFQCQNMSRAGIRPCPYNCHGHGVCNSKNHCHCDNGWAPPLCDIEGYGGSIDSGPALQRGSIGVSSSVATLLVLFLLVFPLLLAVGIVVYCKRDHLRQMWKKSRASKGRSSLRNVRPASNPVGRKAVTRNQSLREFPPTIEHIPNTSTGNIVHDIYPLMPAGPADSRAAPEGGNKGGRSAPGHWGHEDQSNGTKTSGKLVPDVVFADVNSGTKSSPGRWGQDAVKSAGKTGPAKPSSPPPSRPMQPPKRPSNAPPTSAPQKGNPPVRPLLPKSQTKANNRTPGAIDTSRGGGGGGKGVGSKGSNPPFKLAPPPKSPPPVPQSQPTSITGARAALKPVARPRPNINSNNSKDSEAKELKGGGVAKDKIKQSGNKKKDNIPSKSDTKHQNWRNDGDTKQRNISKDSAPKKGSNVKDLSKNVEKKDLDWRRGGDRITEDSDEREPCLGPKPNITKKPSIPKTALRPVRPAPRPHSFREQREQNQ